MPCFCGRNLLEAVQLDQVRPRVVGPSGCTARCDILGVSERIAGRRTEEDTTGLRSQEMRFILISTAVAAASVLVPFLITISPRLSISYDTGLEHIRLIQRNRDVFPWRSFDQLQLFFHVLATAIGGRKGWQSRYQRPEVSAATHPRGLEGSQVPRNRGPASDTLLRRKLLFPVTTGLFDHRLTRMVIAAHPLERCRVGCSLLITIRLPAGDRDSRDREPTTIAGGNGR